MGPRPSVPRLIPLVVLPILLVAACGSAPGRGALRAEGAQPAPTPSTPARVATPSLEPCPAAAPARTQLPAVTLRCLGGGPAVPLGHLPARPYIVNVWASWCEPCRREAPRLRAAAAATRGQVDFLGVDTADRRASALFFLDYFHIRYRSCWTRTATRCTASAPPGYRPPSRSTRPAGSSTGGSGRSAPRS